MSRCRASRAFAPDVGPLGGLTGVIITGTGLDTGSTTVNFGSTPITSFTSISATQITLNAPSTTTAGQVNVTVSDGGGTSATSPFTYLGQPTITSASPLTGPATGGTQVDITGTNLSDASGVDFGTTFVSSLVSDSSTTIVVDAPAGTGNQPITVVTPGGTSNALGTPNFQFVPAITSITPTSGPLTGGTQVTINGADLGNASEVMFGTLQATIVSGSNTASQIIVDAPSSTTAGAVDITVMNADGTSAAVTADQFTYVAAPTLTAIAPATGGVTGGTQVTLTGTNLSNATAVDFGSTTVTSFVSDSGTQIVVDAPAGTGTVPVTVVTVGGTSNSENFNYVPVVTSVSPDVGPLGGASSVTISGDDLSTVTSVNFGSMVVQSGSFTATATTITLMAPASTTAGPVDVTVTDPQGTSGTSAADVFTYVAAPTVASVAPTTGSSNGGTVVTITGTNLANATEVSFGSGNNVTSFTTDVARRNCARGSGGNRRRRRDGHDRGRRFGHLLGRQVPVHPGRDRHFAVLGPDCGRHRGHDHRHRPGQCHLCQLRHDLGAVCHVHQQQRHADRREFAGRHHRGVRAHHGHQRRRHLGRVLGGRFQFRGRAHGDRDHADVRRRQRRHHGDDHGHQPGQRYLRHVRHDGGDLVYERFGHADCPQRSGGVGPGRHHRHHRGRNVGDFDADQYQYKPQVTSVAPASGPDAGGTTVTITGVDLANATSVSFGTVSVPAAQFASNTATQIVVTAPPATVSGTVDITVTNADGTSATSAVDQFTYGPVVSSVVSASGPTTGGNTVTINGTNLAGATSVSFGSVTVMSANFVSNTATQIVVQAPAEAAGTVDVTVVNGGVSVTSAADKYTFVSPLVPTTQLSTLEGSVMTTAGGLVPGVTVTLSGITTTGTTVNLTTQTDNNGNFLFDQIQAGSYSLSRGSTDIYIAGNGTVGNLGGIAGVGAVGDIFLQSGQVGMNYNFNISYVTLLAISLADYLSISASNLFSNIIPAGTGSVIGDGSSNPSSGQSFGSGSTAANTISGSVTNQATTNGVASVSVILSGIDYTGTAIVPLITSTDSSGNYTFTGVNPGTYTLQIGMPSSDQAFSATAGAQGGFAQFNDQIFDISVPVSTTAATFSGYKFEVTPMTTASPSGSTGPVITAGLVETTAATTSDPTVHGIVASGSDGAAITSLQVSVNASATFDATSLLLSGGGFLLNEAMLAQIAGSATDTLADGTYTVSFTAVDADGASTTFSLPQFTLTTSTPTVPTLTVQTTTPGGTAVQSTSGTALGNLIATTGGFVLSNTGNINPTSTAETITLTGMADAGDTLTLVSGSNTSPETTTADSNGDFTFTPTLSQAVTDFTIEATNAAGVSSFSTMFVDLSQPLTTTSYTAGATPDPLSVSAASGATSAVLNLADGFNDPNASNVIVKLETNDGPVYVELFAGTTPQSVDNFLAYINSDDYNQAIFSRLVSNFVLQGGEYQLQSSPTSLATITTLSPFNGEVGITSNPSASNHNMAGTLAFALPSGATTQYNDNGGTDQFFFNLSNDSSTGSRQQPRRRLCRVRAGGERGRHARRQHDGVAAHDQRSQRHLGRRPDQFADQ